MFNGFYVFDNDEIGDCGFIASSTERDVAIEKAKALVEQRQSDNAIVVPVRNSIPFSMAVYHIRFVPGYGIEEPIKPKAGRPKERTGDYERITLEVRSDLLRKIDASGKSRREYIEGLLMK